jgi:centrosomal protein CEP104
VKNITEEGVTVKVDTIGNYLKLIFRKMSMKTKDNPNGQVGVSQLKIFGKKINHLIYYNDVDSETKYSIDRILIDMGIPINDIHSQINDDNYEIAAVDDETKETIKDLLQIMKRAEKTQDFEILKKIKGDIKTLHSIGYEIISAKRQLDIAVAKEDFDTAIKLRVILY